MIGSACCISVRPAITVPRCLPTSATVASIAASSSPRIAGNARFAPDTTHESYHSGGPRELVWRDELAEGGRPFALGPGEAVMVPVMAPHHVRNGPTSSISLSITWRSDWSFEEADARCWNGVLRKAGLTPRAPHRWPRRNRAKALAFRAWRRVLGAR